MLVKLTSALVISAFTIFPAMAETLWSVDQLEQPESAIYDAANDRVIISNISGGPNEANGKGFLSLVAANGELIELKWSEGLHAPKGMAILGDRLFVSDISQVHIIDLQNGNIVESLDAEGAVFLNDLTASDEKVWVSDMMTHTIWEYDNGTLKILIQDPSLEHPNGLFYENGNLIVGSWGTDIQQDFTTKTPGGLLSIDLASMAISPLEGAEDLGNLDGVIRVQDQLIVNDWIAGKVFAYQNGETKLVGQYPMGLADIASNGDTIFLPYMMNNKLDAIDAAEWLK